MTEVECPRCRRIKRLATEPHGIVTDAMLRCPACGAKMKMPYIPVKHRKRGNGGTVLG